LAFTTRRGLFIVKRREGRFSEQPVTGQGAADRQERTPRRLYDQRRNGIRNASRLNAVLNDADDAVWLVPAMALTESSGEAAADRQVSSVPMTQIKSKLRLRRR
jgi:hypothetical protein